VSNAEWTGVPLSAVLEKAGLRSSAVEVVLEGADSGQASFPNPATPGTISFARGLPVAKARSEDVILAYKMNGEDLPVRHGFPVRAVVAGWYGMASVKWLTRILATDRPFDGYFQTFNYTVWERRDGLATLVPVTELQVKSQIARPAPYEVVAAGRPYRVAGAAWTGTGAKVERVEVSEDGGTTWAAAKLTGEDVPNAWRFWEYEWKVPARKGAVRLMARATDSKGRTQPRERDGDRRDAMINHVIPIEVVVR
jgi:DMSO/TMAO reductase YedYZ molybdopterin-dependent catalytic subunit